MQPNVEALVSNTTPINQTNVVDDDLSFSEDMIVEVKVAHPTITEEDEVGAPSQAPRNKIKFGSFYHVLLCSSFGFGTC